MGSVRGPSIVYKNKEEGEGLCSQWFRITKRIQQELRGVKKGRGTGHTIIPPL